MAKNPPSAVFTITEIRKAGDSFEDGPSVFEWNGPEHSSMQGELPLHLRIESVRRNIPGGNKVVEHALSATWQPFTMNGDWDDKWANRATINGIARTGGFARTMYQEFGRFATRMPLVRVQIGVLSFVGLITDFKPTYVRDTMFRWAITFSPHDNETVNEVKSGAKANEKQSVRKWVQDTKNEVEILDVLMVDLKRAPLKTPRVPVFTNVLLQINDGMSRLERIADNDLASDVTNKLMLMASTFRRVRNGARDGALALQTVTSITDVSFDDALEYVRHGAWVHDAITTQWRIAGLSVRAEKDMRERARSKPRAIHYPKRGESLDRISIRYYGTPDNAQLIFKFNNLDSLVFDGTEELIIPETAK